MFKEHSTEKLIEYIKTLPEKEQIFIEKTLSSARKRKVRKSSAPKTEQDVLDSIERGMREIKEAKRTGKPLKSLQETLRELKSISTLKLQTPNLKP